jgi:hypothetical protein
MPREKRFGVEQGPIGKLSASCVGWANKRFLPKKVDLGFFGLACLKWNKLGMPQYPSRAQHADIAAASEMPPPRCGEGEGITLSGGGDNHGCAAEHARVQYRSAQRSVTNLTMQERTPIDHHGKIFLFTKYNNHLVTEKD